MDALDRSARRTLAWCSRGLLVIALGLLSVAPATASSHREAPGILSRPQVDGTDFYLFRSYEPGREDFVTIVANYVPLQDPYGGPNYFPLDPDAAYDIHIDNDGDAVEDLTFRFRFTNARKDIALPVGPPGAQILVPVPLVNVGPVLPGDTSNLNVVRTYEVSLLRGSVELGLSRPVTDADGGSSRFGMPFDYIGQKSFPDYDAYASLFLHDVRIPGCETNARIFAGQRKDPFVVNLGETFDLVNLNPVGPEDDERDDLADKNVTSLILEVPIGCLTSGSKPVIAGWTTSSLPRSRALGSASAALRSQAIVGRRLPIRPDRQDLVQVSRLGMPLVNEVVIGLPDKDEFNGSHPRNDGDFLSYVTNPTLPELLQILFGVQAPNNFPRNDLVAAFLTGVAGLNQTATPAEQMRLNVTIPPTPRGSQNRLGVVAGDNAGFPNGRRPGDDVVDIELRVAMGLLCHAGLGVCDPADAPDGTLPYTDGAIVDASFFDDSFPYLRTPIPGSPNQTP